MKSFLLVIWIITIGANTFAQPDNIRHSYISARNQEGIRNFLASSEKLNLNVSAEKGYRGVALAMYADIADGVYTKLDYFNRGKDLLEAAIQEQPNNAEIRFLRLTVQAEAPFMLGYSGEIEEDADVVFHAFNSGQIRSNHFFWSIALRYILDCDEISVEKRNRFKKFNS